MDKHGLLDKLPIYRMMIANQVPWLGDLPHTPMHLYLRKEGEDIVEIKLLDSPLPQAKTDLFLKQLQEKSNLKELTKVVKIDVMGQRTKHFNMLDLDVDFDFDFDAKEGYVSVAEKQR